MYKTYFRWTGFTSPQDFRKHVETIRERGEEWMETKAEVDILSPAEVLETVDKLADALADAIQRVG